jgi:hypothetical protein
MSSVSLMPSLSLLYAPASRRRTKQMRTRSTWHKKRREQ